MKWYVKVLRQYADFNGRARRKEYWLFMLFNILFAIAALVIDSASGTTTDENPYGAFYLIYMLIMLIPGLAVSVRRLHDTGKSGWMLLITLIPIIGGIWLFILMLSNGNAGANSYGMNPKEVGDHEIDKSKNASIVLVIASALWIVLDLMLHIRYGIFGDYISPISILVDCLNLVIPIALMMAGISMFKDKDDSKTAAVYFIIAAAAWISTWIIGLTAPMYDPFFGQFLIIVPVALLILGVMMLQKKENKKIAAIILIIGAIFWMFNLISFAFRIMKYGQVDAIFEASQLKILMPISLLYVAFLVLSSKSRTAYSSSISSQAMQMQTENTIAPQQIPSSDSVPTFSNEHTASIKDMKCPDCGTHDFNIIGVKGAALRSVATTAAFGAIGNIVAGHSAAKNMETQPIQYKCKKCKHKFIGEPVNASDDELLFSPCAVYLERVSSFVGAIVPQIVYLNGIKIGPVKNGQKISFLTNVKRNTIFVTDQHGLAFPGHYTFEAQPGTSVLVRFNRRFK